MATLKSGIEKFSLSNVEAKRLLANAKSYRDEGFTAQEANERAILDFIKEAKADEEDIHKQVKQKKSTKILNDRP